MSPKRNIRPLSEITESSPESMPYDESQIQDDGDHDGNVVVEHPNQVATEKNKKEEDEAFSNSPSTSAENLGGRSNDFNKNQRVTASRLPASVTSERKPATSMSTGRTNVGSLRSYKGLPLNLSSSKVAKGSASSSRVAGLKAPLSSTAAPPKGSFKTTTKTAKDTDDGATMVQSIERDESGMDAVTDGTTSAPASVPQTPDSIDDDPDDLYSNPKNHHADEQRHAYTTYSTASTPNTTSSFDQDHPTTPPPNRPPPTPKLPNPDSPLATSFHDNPFQPGCHIAPPRSSPKAGNTVPSNAPHSSRSSPRGGLPHRSGTLSRKASSNPARYAKPTTSYTQKMKDSIEYALGVAAVRRDRDRDWSRLAKDLGGGRGGKGESSGTVGHHEAREHSTGIARLPQQPVGIQIEALYNDVDGTCEDIKIHPSEDITSKAARKESHADNLQPLDDTLRNAIISLLNRYIVPLQDLLQKYNDVIAEKTALEEELKLTGEIEGDQEGALQQALQTHGVQARRISDLETALRTVRADVIPFQDFEQKYKDVLAEKTALEEELELTREVEQAQEAALQEALQSNDAQAKKISDLDAAEQSARVELQAARQTQNEREQAPPALEKVPKANNNNNNNNNNEDAQTQTDDTTTPPDNNPQQAPQPSPSHQTFTTQKKLQLALANQNATLTASLTKLYTGWPQLRHENDHLRSLLISTRDTNIALVAQAKTAKRAARAWEDEVLALRARMERSEREMQKEGEKVRSELVGVMRGYEARIAAAAAAGDDGFTVRGLSKKVERLERMLEEGAERVDAVRREKGVVLGEVERLLAREKELEGEMEALKEEKEKQEKENGDGDGLSVPVPVPPPQHQPRYYDSSPARQIALWDSPDVAATIQQVGSDFRAERRRAREDAEREEAIFEAVRKWKLGKYYPPARKGWREKVRMSKWERWEGEQWLDEACSREQREEVVLLKGRRMLR